MLFAAGDVRRYTPENPGHHQQTRAMAKWIDDIVTAMENLGGQASYEELYEEVRRVRTEPLPKTWKAIVRNQVESYSSDSENYTPSRQDLFYSVYGLGGGVWALRKQIKKR